MESIFKLIVHDADVVVPDTGIHTASNVSNGDANSIGIILAGVCLTIIAGIIALSIIKRKKACAGLVAAVLIAGLAIATPIMSANAAKRDIDFSVAETVTATIDREKGETFVVVPVDITLNEATDNGYELYMYGGDLTDGTNTITQVSADGSKITEGTWGIVAGADSTPAIDDEVWNQIGTSSSPKKVSIADGEIAAGTTIRVYYGVSIDDSTPAGDYTTTIGFLTEEDLGMTLEESYENAGAEKITVGSSSYYTMQSMTPEICEQAVESELQVADSRDEKIYWIAKLKDGKCWMTQNLDFDLPDTALTSEDTDLTQYGVEGYTDEYGYDNNDGIISWVPAQGTVRLEDINSPSGSISWSEARSMDPGDAYWTDTWYDTTADECFNNWSCNFLPDMDNNDKFSATPYPGNGEHGHIGNYYNWPAAVATNNMSESGRDSGAPQNSICPAGWKLPDSGNYTLGQLGTNDFYNLLMLYSDDYVEIDDWYYQASDHGLTTGPLWFVRGGVYDGGINNTGVEGFYWSSNRVPFDDAIYLNIWIDSVGVDDFYNYPGYTGMSVRCLAR